MRWRLLAFVPPAAFLVAITLLLASSLVSALESNVRWRTVEVVPVEWIESECRRIERRLRAMSRQATGCDADLRCLDSPILCPISMDATHEREYRALRRDHAARCGPAPGPTPAEPSSRIPDPACPAISEAADASARSMRGTGATFVF